LVPTIRSASRLGYISEAQKKSQDNPLLLREAILMLSVERYRLKEFGFRRDPPWILRRLYGLDHEDAAPFGTIFHMYLNCAQSEGRPENSVSQADVESEEDRKNQMLRILDDEIKRLEKLRELSLALCFERIEYNKLTHLVPPPAVSERLLGYETHLMPRVRQDNLPARAPPENASWTADRSSNQSPVVETRVNSVNAEAKELTPFTVVLCM